MLLKLIKHDFRALSRTLLPLNLSVVGAGVLEAVLLAVVVRTLDLPDPGVTGTTAAVALTLPIMLIGVAILASATVSLILIAVHFYRNLIGDEGYLMFTLPTTSGRILWSKLITGMLYLAINAAAIAIAIDLPLLFGTGTEGLVNTDLTAFIARAVPELERMLSGVNLPGTIAAGVLFAVTGAASQLLKLYFAMAVGGLSAKKHKLLATIGVYFGTNLVLGFLKNVLRALFALGTFSVGADGISGAAAVSSYLWYSVGTSLAACALFFLLSRLMFTKRLNLL